MCRRLKFILFIIFLHIFSYSLYAQAGTFKRTYTEVSADSIKVAIDRGDSIKIERCKIYGSLIKKGTLNSQDTISSFIGVSNSSFDSLVDLSHLIFLKDVIFLNDKFSYDGVEFTDTEFKEKAGFQGSIFSREPLFNHTKFHGTACFSNTDFNDTIDFSRTIFSTAVDFTSMQFEDIDISWKQLNGRFVCDNATALELMKSFEEKRKLDDADGVYLFLKKKETSNMKWYNIIKYFRWFLGIICGYGVKPFITLLCSGVIIVSWTLLYTLRSNSIREIEKELGHRKRRRKYRVVHKCLKKRLYDAFYFSFQTFIIGVVSDWYPTDESLIKGRRNRFLKYRTLSMIEGALGWILVILFIISLGKKFIR